MVDTIVTCTHVNRSYLLNLPAIIGRDHVILKALTRLNSDATSK